MNHVTGEGTNTAGQPTVEETLNLVNKVLKEKIADNVTVLKRGPGRPRKVLVKKTTDCVSKPKLKTKKGSKISTGEVSKVLKVESVTSLPSDESNSGNRLNDDKVVTLRRSPRLGLGTAIT